MKKIVLLSIIATTVFFSCSKDETIYGSGHLISEYRDVQPFTKIASEGVFEVTITQGATQSVEIMADDNVIHRVRTTVSNNELLLSLTDDNFQHIRLKARITVPHLNGIRNDGVGDISATIFDESGLFSISNSGTAAVRVSGSSKDLNVYNEGSGSIHAFNFRVINAIVENIGAGNIEVNCAESLDITIEGSGNVYYKGAPLINSTTAGSGKIIRVD